MLLTVVILFHRLFLSRRIFCHINNCTAGIRFPSWLRFLDFDVIYTTKRLAQGCNDQVGYATYRGHPVPSSPSLPSYLLPHQLVRQRILLTPWPSRGRTHMVG